MQGQIEGGRSEAGRRPDHGWDGHRQRIEVGEQLRRELRAGKPKKREPSEPSSSTQRDRS
jgi:hypothetical protein